MSVWTVILIIAVIAAIILGVLYFVGRKMQAKQEDQRAQLDQMAQTVNMLEASAFPFRQRPEPCRNRCGTVPHLRVSAVSLFPARTSGKCFRCRTYRCFPLCICCCKANGTLFHRGRIPPFQKAPSDRPFRKSHSPYHHRQRRDIFRSALILLLYDRRHYHILLFRIFLLFHQILLYCMTNNLYTNP